MPVPVIVVHGGATKFREEHIPAIIHAVEYAAENGMWLLEKGASAISAAEAAIWTLEETDLFTAGRGARANRDGYVELNAMIMDGNKLESGAVIAVQDVVHPISLARYVLERTPNYQVAGLGAKKLYDDMIESGYRLESSPGETKSSATGEGHDTVGCVVIDSHGRIASASSSSGWPGQLPGRIGDSPIIGAGVYANETAAASCTGKGEQILRIAMARMAVLYVEEGLDAHDASAKAMRLLKEKTSGEAGLIMLDKDGIVGLGFDTPHMPVAVSYAGKDTYSSMTPKLPPSLG
ncbi:MAG: isoaspartyl peptidase/L-asparaginase [Candidatus Thorarchaeota archaeon]|jgi:beta-aspartyl-peptidase (threonine type)